MKKKLLAGDILNYKGWCSFSYYGVYITNYDTHTFYTLPLKLVLDLFVLLLFVFDRYGYPMVFLVPQFFSCHMFCTYLIYSLS